MLVVDPVEEPPTSQQEMDLHLSDSTREMRMIYSQSSSASRPRLVEEAVVAAEEGRDSLAACLVVMICMPRLVKEEVVVGDQCIIIIITTITVELGKWLLSRTSCLVALKISTKVPPRR